MHFELVSPERLLFSDDVQEVSVPGTEGDFHSAAEPCAGAVDGAARASSSVTRDDGARERIFVRGGFAEVNPQGADAAGRDGHPARRAVPRLLAQQVRDAEEDVADARTTRTRRRAQETLEHLKALQGALPVSGSSN